jgi:hypothetical protein
MLKFSFDQFNNSRFHILKYPKVSNTDSEFKTRVPGLKFDSPTYYLLVSLKFLTNQFSMGSHLEENLYNFWVKTYISWWTQIDFNENAILTMRILSVTWRWIRCPNQFLFLVTPGCCISFWALCYKVADTQRCFKES